MALVRKVGKLAAAAAEEKERVGLADLVPQYSWETTTGEAREGIKLHFISFLPERAEEDKVQPAQISGFLDALVDPVTGSARGGRNCVPLRVTGSAGVALAGRVLAAVALAEGGDAAAAMAAFDATEKFTVKGGSLFVDLRPEAAAEALRDEDAELVALYAANGALSGRVMYAPPFEFEEGFE